MSEIPVNTGQKKPSLDSYRTPVTREIDARQLELLYSQNHLAALSTVIAGLLLGWILWEVVDHQRILIWLGVLFAAAVGRVLLVWQYRRVKPSTEDSQKWRNMILGVAGLFGAIWGSASIFLFPGTSMPHIAFMGFVIVGIAGGAVPYLAAVWPVYLLTALPATLVFAAQLFILGGSIASVMGLLILFFSAMMIFTSWRMKETVVESIKLRFDKETLARDLQLARAVKEQATMVAKESDERVHVLAEAPFEGIFIHEQGQILDANRTLLEMLGVEMEDALGRQVLDFVPVESRNRVEAELQNPTGEFFNCIINKPNGDTVEVEVRGRHFPRKGRTIRVVSIRQLD
jgi:PAS domain S-box-containing protein